MKRGEGDVVSGWHNKLQSAIANVTPAAILAEQHRRMRRATAAGVPAIYVNDNFGQWRSDFRRTLAHCTARSSPGRLVSRCLRPTTADYFVLKPKHSGFYDTTLDTLLKTLRIRRVILNRSSRWRTPMRRRQRDQAKLEQMIVYAQTAMCRTRILLSALGKEPVWENCETCDNCRGVATRAEGAAEGVA